MTPKKRTMMTGIPSAVSPAIGATEAIFDEEYWEQKAKRYMSERDAALALAERRAGEIADLMSLLDEARGYLPECTGIKEDIDYLFAAASPPAPAAAGDDA